MKEIINAFKKDKEYRLSILSLIMAMLFFAFFFYILRNRVIDKTNIIPLLLSMGGTVFFMITCAIYIFKSKTVLSWLVETRQQDPKKKVITFTIVVAIICLISYLLGYSTSRIIMNSIFVVIFYAIFVFQFYGKTSKRDTK